MSIFEDDILYLVNEASLSLLDIEIIIFTNRYNLSSRHFSILSVQSISMMYSIWEGFVQKSFKRYIEEINNCGISFFNYADSLKIYLLENEFKQLRDYPTKDNKKIKFINDLSTFFHEEKHDICRDINTESNVGFEVLNKIMETFNLKYFPENWEKYSKPKNNLKDLLNSFVKYRNSVSHGGDISSEEKISQQVFFKYRELINNLMYGIFEKMNYGLEQQTYLKK